jgi:glycosyltransferase involved in cell wall biosynthesis
MAPLRVALVTNIPAPYRVPVLNLLAQAREIELTVFYAARTEPDRQWDLPALTHRHVFLDGQMVTRSGRYIHHNPQVWDELLGLSPDVVVTTGYNPTHLLGHVYARLYGRQHVVMTDGTVESELRLSWAHRLLRRHVIANSAAGVAASHGGWRLLRSHGLPAERLHLSPLCANPEAGWEAAARMDAAERDIDLLFSGRLEPVKNAGFALGVAAAAARRLGRPLRMAILGAGSQLEALRAQSAALAPLLQVEVAGHVAQRELPGWFGRARLFLFPSRWDPWGVVANEAMEAGVPVLVSPHAGVAGDLVRDGVNGRVLPLQEPAWVDALCELLIDDSRRQQLADEARRTVTAYRADNAAAGLLDAVLQAGRWPGAARHSRFTRRPRVVCVQRRLPHYRVPLFAALRQRLALEGVEFLLVHGQPTPAEATKDDRGELPWAHDVRTRYLLGERLVWQTPEPHVTGADLVIVTQENKLLWNLLAMTLRRPARLAFWGHGRNFQSGRPSGLSERVKHWMIGAVDWWFAYTAVSADLVTASGFPAQRITTLDNAVDTQALAALCASIGNEEAEAFRAGLGIAPGAPVGLFLGSLYADKRIDFLLAAAEALHARVPGFHLLVVGNGPLGRQVQAAVATRPWLHALGARTGRDKALCLRSAQLMLNPGLVGLGILDAFVGGLPLATTDCGLHSPEIAYLNHGVNGVMTADTLDAYVQACQALLTNPGERERLAVAARADAARYTVENMAERFAQGIMSALHLPGR